MGVQMEWDEGLGRWVMAADVIFKELFLSFSISLFFPSVFLGRTEMAVVMPP